MIDRRRDERASRVATGVGVGLPVAVIISWMYQLKTGQPLPDHVETAVGSIVTTLSICFHDVRYVVLTVFRKVLRRF